MFKKVFASVLSMFMVLTLLVPTVSVTEIKANDAEPYAVVIDLPMSITKSINKTATYNSKTTNVPIVIKLNYIKHNNNGQMSYSSFSATLIPTDDSTYGEFYATARQTPKVTVYTTTQTVYVTGEADIYYNAGVSFQNVFVKTVSYSITFNYN